MSHRRSDIRAAAAPVVALLWGLTLAAICPPARAAAEPSSQPVATDRGQVGQLLRNWYGQGTAAGNVGDYYDNRDGGHSRLRIERHPQLRVVKYTEAQKKRRLNWGAQLFFLYRHVTFGNSSTASSDIHLGGNTRRCLYLPRAADVLYRQYTRSHLYVYPEHRDHDPGHNGCGGYGDLFPANVPYLITSQGSSGSDRPFVEAVAYTLAAFGPDVKKLLINRGLLMPTVQMILRSCSGKLKTPRDYLTGLAHPSALDGRDIDLLKMVRMAHSMRADEVPPMVQLRVVEADRALHGRDYFDPRRREELFATPAAIARVVRSVRYRRRMVVSAEASYDVNERPLTYRWVVLRGDEGRIGIRPLNEAGSVVELRVAYHERRRVRRGSPLESSRVDIAAFVHNGAYHSAPGFVCFYYLDNEARTYDDDGRILEVGYDYGDSTIGYSGGDIHGRTSRYHVSDWAGLLELLREGQTGLAAELLRDRLGKAALATFRAAEEQLLAARAREVEPGKACDEAEGASKRAATAVAAARKELSAAKQAHATKPTDATAAAVAAAEAKLKAAEVDRASADRRRNDARRKLRQAERATAEVLTRSHPRLGSRSVKQRLEEALNDIKNDVNLYFRSRERIDKLCQASGDKRRRQAFDRACQKLLKLRIARKDSGGALELSPAIDGPEPPAERLTKYERNRIEWFNIAILQNVLYPGMLNVPYRRNFVSRALTTPKDWRDVYRYDAGGRLIGWTRHRRDGKQEFTAHGALVVKTDRLGRAIEARTVRYTVEKDGRRLDVRQLPGDRILCYEYISDKDRVGRIAESKPAGP